MGKYVGVMLLFTVVVTYSRYMSSLEGSDQAKVARFEVGIRHKGCQGTLTEDNVCESGTFRPNSRIEYNFEVDTTKLEVATDLTLTIIVHSDFQILDLTDVDVSKYSNNRISFVRSIQVGKENIKDYTLSIMYVGEDIGKTYTDPIVSIDYSAEQKD